MKKKNLVFPDPWSQTAFGTES